MRNKPVFFKTYFSLNALLFRPLVAFFCFFHTFFVIFKIFLPIFVAPRQINALLN